jgi:hypothetical protein
MQQAKIKNLIKDGAKVVIDSKNPQRRQVITTAGKIRLQVNKGNPANGKTNN